MSPDLVLDLDFDYCVHPTVSHGRSGINQRPSEASIWLTAAELSRWLGSRGLLRPSTFAGVVESHEQVLPIWRERVEAGTLRTPFAVLHVDAHPDIMDLEPAVADGLDGASRLDDEVIARARPGDFLQFVVRLGWVDRIWMLFPDHERDRIAALGAASTEAAGAIVRKSVLRTGATPGGGVDMLVGIGPRLLAVGLHTRASLPHLPPPSLTVLAHSPEFVPSHADGEFHALARHLGAAA